MTEQISEQELDRLHEVTHGAISRNLLDHCGHAISTAPTSVRTEHGHRIRRAIDEASSILQAPVDQEDLERLTLAGLLLAESPPQSTEPLPLTLEAMAALVRWEGVSAAFLLRGSVVLHSFSERPFLVHPGPSCPSPRTLTLLAHSAEDLSRMRRRAFFDPAKPLDMHDTLHRVLLYSLHEDYEIVTVLLKSTAASKSINRVIRQIARKVRKDLATPASQ